MVQRMTIWQHDKEPFLLDGRIAPQTGSYPRICTISKWESAGGIRVEKNDARFCKIAFKNRTIFINRR